MKSGIKERFSELDSNISLLNKKVNLEDNTKNVSEKVINNLFLTIDKLNLSVRSSNCLNKIKVISITLLFTHIVGEVKLALERSEGMVRGQKG